MACYRVRVFLLFLSFFCLPVWASFEKRLVKITSARCGDTKEFRGSGLLFQEGGIAFVLTSSHVVLHGTTDYCHFVSNSDLGTLQANFAASEWGNGLALLWLPKMKPDATWLKLSDLDPVSVQKGDGVTVTGYPFASQKPVEDGRGFILESNAPSLLFALVTHLIETQGAHGEFGMSGGPVFLTRGGFLGVLSHQKLVPDNHLLVIPATEVARWLKLYFSGPGRYLPYFYQSPDAQLMSNTEHVWSGNILFHFSDVVAGRGSVVVDYLENHMSIPFSDPTGRVYRMLKYMDPKQVMAIAEVVFFKPGEKTRLPVGSLSEWLRLIADTTLTVRASRRLFHEDRWNLFDSRWKEIRESESKLQRTLTAEATALKSRLEAIGKAFDSIPEHPAGTGPVQVQSCLYHFDWLWARHEEIEDLLTSSTYRKGWEDLSRLNSAEAAAIRDSLKEIDKGLDVVTL